MNAPLETLFKLIRNDQDRALSARILFMNAQFCDVLGMLGAREIVCQQVFKLYAQDLEIQGYSLCHDVLGLCGEFDIALVLLPKNMLEARFMVAQAAQKLRAGGILACAAENKAGGGRIVGMLQDFGFARVQSISGNKSRAVYGYADALDGAVVQNALDEGGVQAGIVDGRFSSQAGLFGWDKIDRGSEILASFLPETLRGIGADFGCGYGYLSDFVLSRCTGVARMVCIDADVRAVELCRSNLAQHGGAHEFHWLDLTKVQGAFANLDFIVMNPPFHEGKKRDIGIGRDFIETAYQSLKKRGELWMVANVHLSYEDVLAEKFQSVKKHYEGKGFKVFQAVK